MSDYNKYVLAINKIFEVIGKLKTELNTNENITYISNIEEYKQVVINAAEQFSNKKDTNVQMSEQPVMEKLSSTGESI